MPEPALLISPLVELHQGDCLQVLKTFQANTIDCVVTSPPYFGQIDYECSGQIGLEESLNAYLDALTATFQEVLRVLKEGAVCWIVIGDSSNNYSPIRTKASRRSPHWTQRRKLQDGFREKEPLDVPHCLKERLRETGWRHRQTLIWDKGQSSNPPNSDAAPTCHESILMMVKWSKPGRMYANAQPLKSSVLRYQTVSDPVHPCPYPPSLCRELLVHSQPLTGSVLDPFAGSGVTLKVAAELSRRAIGIELNPDYCALIRDRLSSQTLAQCS